MPKLRPIRFAKYYLGIDPGKSGGLCRLSESGEVAALSVMPDTELDTWQWFQGWGTEFALIELVHSMPQQGVSSTFTFGKGYGGLRMALTAVGIPFETVTPQAWQKGLGITPKKKIESKAEFKARLRAFAQRLFPSLDLWGRTKGEQLSVCDALLIAEFNRRVHARKES
jgi:crossover junction endodeoxyribonuclease RuvC